MKFTNKCILAVVAWSDCQDVMAARIHLLVLWIWRQKLNQFCSMYLQWHSQLPPYKYTFTHHTDTSKKGEWSCPCMVRSQKIAWKMLTETGKKSRYG